MSHGMADVQWHSLRGLEDYFIAAMAKSDFHGNREEAHLAADAGAEFTLRHSTRLDYLNKTWHVPIKDIIEIYKRHYNATATEERQVPLASHIQYCMTAAFAASRIDVEFGGYMFGYYGSKSPFLTEETFDYYKGGISHLAGSVADCYSEMVNAFEKGIAYQQPDTLCTDFFRTTDAASSTTMHRQHCLKYPQASFLATAYHDTLQQYYDPTTGVLTLTTSSASSPKSSTGIPKGDDSLPLIRHMTDHSTVKRHDLKLANQRQQHHQRQQHPFEMPVSTSSIDTVLRVNKGSMESVSQKSQCANMFDDDDYSVQTLSLLTESNVGLGHQLVQCNHFYSNATMRTTENHIAISAPYYQQKGAVFILNKEDLFDAHGGDRTIVQDIRHLAHTMLEGDVHHGRFGWSVTAMDINQDGLDDLVISTPFGEKNDEREGGKIEIYISLPQSSEKKKMDFKKVELQLTLSTPQEQQQQQQQKISSSSLLGTVLVSVAGLFPQEKDRPDRQDNRFNSLVVGCPLCSSFSGAVGNQAGRVYIFKSFVSKEILHDSTKMVKEADLIIENPNHEEDNYDHFGESILFMQKTGILLIGAPGYSTENKQRVGRVYAFDMRSNKLKWIVTGSEEFQQYGKVLATDKNQSVLLVSSPSEKTKFRYRQSYWQAGTIRLYDWSRFIPNMNDKEGLQAEVDRGKKPREFNTSHGMTSILLGRANAGHLGQSLFLLNQELWIGEPMSDKENGKVYRWRFGHNEQHNDNEIKCMKTSRQLLERFGSQIGPLGNNLDDSPICITSQRYGQQNAR
ncbi:hypothetical protein BDF20DRAFT_657581 [Mycotypha africana]|uniref:uncharacterized protein n=1 Tax=Mycotypha africana TaxID=64632 RepID=UPI0023000691|nr:uncharacterized protein BDF20DRAFT_657581 [Mycotypha africana]KAI8973527.1 hypothetical protein BDF20DRAFT_657581 [Mycotypha africana]